MVNTQHNFFAFDQPQRLTPSFSAAVRPLFPNLKVEVKFSVFCVSNYCSERSLQSKRDRKREIRIRLGPRRQNVKVEDKGT